MRILLLFLLLFGSCTLSDAASFKTLFVNIGTGGINGLYYPTGRTIANILNRSRQDNIRFVATVEPTGGAVFNINAIHGGHLLFGLAQSDRQYQARHGEAEWKNKGRQENLRAVFSLYPEVVTLIAAADSGIKTVSDLRGKRVNIGNRGSGYRQNALDVLKDAGLAPDRDLSISDYRINEASRMLQAGKLDAFFYTVGHPNKSTANATNGSRRVIFVPIRASQALLAAKPYYEKASIQTDLYPDAAGQGEIESISVRAGLVTSANVPEDIVYRLTRSVFENLDNLKEQQPAFANLNRKIMAGDNTIPLHPGARRYYLENGLLP